MKGETVMKKKVMASSVIILVLITCIAVSVNNRLPGTVVVKGDFRGENTALSGKTPENADSYNIYRKSGENGDFDFIG